jgi:hypothetical protein
MAASSTAYSLVCSETGTVAIVAGAHTKSLHDKLGACSREAVSAPIVRNTDLLAAQFKLKPGLATTLVYRETP